MQRDGGQVIQRLLPALHGSGRVTFVFQELDQRGAELRVVIDDEHGSDAMAP